MRLCLTRGMGRALGLAVLLCLGTQLVHAQQVGSSTASERWFKGNLHTHTLWSDGDDFPEMIAIWYREHGYHFLALSDHNILNQGMKWMPLKTIESRGGPTVFAKYVERFGEHWVETRGTPEADDVEVRLKPLDEVRPLVEEAGHFLMIPSEEITDDGAHINATNIHTLIEPQGGQTVRETIYNNFRAVDAQAKQLGRLILPHLNHPNLGDKGIAAEDLAALVEDEFFEVWNGVDQDGDLGSNRRHSLEALWDITSTLRITEYKAPPLYGLATDDSHNYHGKDKASPGRGWIEVRCRWLTPESLLNAMRRGAFYASTGVELERLEFDEASQTLTIQIKPDGEAQFTTQFIGTPRDFDHTATQRVDPTSGLAVPGTLDYSADVGRVFATVSGTTAVYPLTGEELFIRATITSDQAPFNPTSESPLQKAWTQPIGWQKWCE